jgi:hypothetical protein
LSSGRIWRKSRKYWIPKINSNHKQKVNYLIYFKKDRESSAARILGHIESDCSGQACADARIAFGSEPEVDFPQCVLGAFEIQTLHLVRQEVYISIKTSPNVDPNEGAISRNTRGIYVNGIGGSDLCKRMVELRDVFQEIEIRANTNDGMVMGNGGGVNYVVYAKFDHPNSAVEYLRSLGYTVKGQADFS